MTKTITVLLTVTRTVLVTVGLLPWYWGRKWVIPCLVLSSLYLKIFTYAHARPGFYCYVNLFFQT